MQDHYLTLGIQYQDENSFYLKKMFPAQGTEGSRQQIVKAVNAKQPDIWKKILLSIAPRTDAFYFRCFDGDKGFAHYITSGRMHEAIITPTSGPSSPMTGFSDITCAGYDLLAPLASIQKQVGQYIVLKGPLTAAVLDLLLSPPYNHSGRICGWWDIALLKENALQFNSHDHGANVTVWGTEQEIADLNSLLAQINPYYQLLPVS